MFINTAMPLTHSGWRNPRERSGTVLDAAAAGECRGLRPMRQVCGEAVAGRKHPAAPAIKMNLNELALQAGYRYVCSTAIN